MQQSGTRNEQHGLEAIGLEGTGKLFWNLTEAALYERSIARGETRLSADGALVADSGAHRHLSPADHYIVREAATEESVDWESINALSRPAFDGLKTDFLAHASTRTLFAQDVMAGDVPVRVLTEHAWHALTLRNLLRPLDADAIAGAQPQLTILCVPSFKAEPEKHGVRHTSVLAADVAAGLVLVAGTAHAGEVRAALLLALGQMLPEAGTLPLAASASRGATGDVALFLGLPATGKTALAAGPDRTLIADGAVGWRADGVRGLETGAYLRADHITPETEPDLVGALARFGTVLENVPLDPESRAPLLNADSPAENARAAVPLAARGTVETGRAPTALFLLSCDPLGILPPIARLTPAQAMYHFLSGYSAHLPDMGTGIEEAQTAFAPGFAAPFFATHPARASALLRPLLAQEGLNCWLVNTGWIGGKAGVGRRVPLETTRRLIAAALDGTLDAGEWRTDSHFGFTVPKAVEGVDARLLDPARSWASRMDYAKTARQLVTRFGHNFARFESLVDDEVRGAQPSLAIAAE